VGDDQTLGVRAAGKGARLVWGVVYGRRVRVVGLAEEEVGVDGQVVQRGAGGAVAGVGEGVLRDLGSERVGLGAVVYCAADERQVTKLDVVAVRQRAERQYVGLEVAEEGSEPGLQGGRGVDGKRCLAGGQFRRTPRRSTR
jgi:hypothetical protein